MLLSNSASCNKVLMHSNEYDVIVAYHDSKLVSTKLVRDLELYLVKRVGSSLKPSKQPCD